MKPFLAIAIFSTLWGPSYPPFAQNHISPVINSRTPSGPVKYLFLDIHHLKPGKLTYEALAKAHAKDLATEKAYNVKFLKYWVDENNATMYCLSSARNSESIIQTHAAAHGLMPDRVFFVTEGTERALKGGKNFFIDVHALGAGNINAKDMELLHQKDLAVQKKYGVNFIDYWINTKNGVIICLSEASCQEDILKTHKEAHGLIPKYISEVRQGQ